VRINFTFISLIKKRNKFSSQMSYICTLLKHSEVETASAEPSAHLCNEAI